MYRSVKTIITIFLCLMLLTSIMPFALAADVSESVDIPISVEYDNISIGAGGSFFQPTINPIDSSQYIVTSDMGGIYYTSTSGNQWDRTNICRISASCMTDDGVYFAGAYGLYVSYDNGQTMKMIYPREDIVQYTINRLGRDNPLMVADGYDNGYVIAVNTYGDYVYFITMDWNSSGTIRICRSLFDGTALEVWTVAAPVASPMNVTYRMEIDNNTIFYSDGSNVWSYDISTAELTVIYTAQGSIVDMKKIGEYYFILDDTDTATNVIYTTDFASFDDLNTFNTLTNEFRWGGVDRTLEWHYSAISGTDFNNIWLAFYSPVSGISDIGGVLKFDGISFTWAYDQVFTTRSIGWTGGGIAPIYGICADPNDSNHCIMTNIDTVYDIYFDSETLNRNVNTLHCVDYENGYYQTTGLDCQTTYFVREDPFDSQHLIICTTDLGLQISYDGGTSFSRHEVLSDRIDNTCYDLYFDKETEGLLYGIWSSRHDAPYTPKLSDANAEGGFAVSYDGGMTWKFDYSTGIPENSIPVRMSVVPYGDELMIAVATFNNGFYVSYDTGKTFTAINDGIDAYNEMIWGEDVVITDEYIYCLTASHSFDGLTPSALYQYNRLTAEIISIDMGEIVLANSMTYDERYGLFVSVTPYYRREYIEEINRSYWVNYGGGVYRLGDSGLEQIFETDTGAYNTTFTSAGTMYITDVYGTLFVYDDGEYSVYADNMFHRLKNISFSLDESILYVTTLGGGTYRMPVMETTPFITEHSVTFVDYDGTLLSAQTVTEGSSAVLPENPVREPDSDYHYTFTGWDISTETVYSDLTVTAQYDYAEHTKITQNATDATCTAEGYTGDILCSDCGYLIESGIIIEKTEHTTAPAVSGNDGTHTISCSVCNEVLSTADCTDDDSDYLCDACGYQLALPEYTVTFINYDGTVLSTQTVAEGDAAVLPETPTREPDANYHYTFSKWSESTDYVDCDLTVYARYVYKSHTNVMKNTADPTCTEEGYTGDSVCSSCGYVTTSGEVIPALGHTEGTIFENSDETHTVICSVCDSEIGIENCADSDTDGYCDECGYKFAVYYTVTFVDWNGTELSTQTVLEGEAAILPDDPARESDAEGSYTFTGWDSDVTNIQSDLIVTAVYTMTAHTSEIRGAYAATCTEEGYTGDTYCSVCGILLEEGTAISMTDHVEGDAETNNDGTHTSACTECGTEMNTEICADNDNNGYCDSCAYAMNVTKFTKASALTNGKQYLIVGSGYALRSTIAAESVSLTESNGYYVTAADIPDDMLWTYDNGYLYTTYNGQTYYLTAYRGFGSSYTLSVETQRWWASTWSYNNNSLTTQVFDWRYRTTKYLNINNGTATLSSSGSITLYQLEN